MQRFLCVGLLILVQSVLFCQGWYEDSLRSLRGSHDALSTWEDMKEDLIRGIRRSIRNRSPWKGKLDHVKNKEWYKDVSKILDDLDRAKKGTSEAIIRKFMRKWKMKEPMGFKAFNGTFTPAEAKRKCVSLRMRIAKIRSGVEQSFAWEAASTVNNAFCHIGLYRKSKVLKWADSTGLGHFSRLTGDGADYGRVIATAEDQCGVISKRDGEWIMKSCSMKLPVLCEYTPAGTPTPVTKPGATTKPAPATLPSRPEKLPTASRKPPTRKPAPAPAPPVPPSRPWKPPTAGREPPTRRPVPVGPSAVGKPPATTAPSAVSFDVRMDADFDKASVDYGFKKSIIRSASRTLKVSEDKVKIVSMSRGSIIVKFEVQVENRDENVVKKMKDSLKKAINDGTFTATVGGRVVRPARTGALVFPPPNDKKESSGFSIFIPIIIVLLVALIVTGIIIFLWMRRFRPQRRADNTAVAYEASPPQMSKEAAASAPPSYIGPPPEYDAPPKYRDCVNNTTSKA